MPGKTGNKEVTKAVRTPESSFFLPEGIVFLFVLFLIHLNRVEKPREPLPFQTQACEANDRVSSLFQLLRASLTASSA